MTTHRPFFRQLTSHIYPRTLGRIIATLTLAIFLSVALRLTLPLALTPPVLAQEPNRAAIIVQFDDHARIVRTIDFTAPISGFTALQQSGLDLAYTQTAFGPIVCAIEGVGCPATDCFCNDNYWGYNYWDGDQWQGYQVGAGSSTISQTGSVEGWRWGAFGDSIVSTQPTLAADQALTWLKAQQQPADGGYGSPAASIEALLAVGANHIPASTWKPQGDFPSLAAYVMQHGPDYTNAAIGAAGKTAVALSFAELCLPPGTSTPAHFFNPLLGAYTDQSGPNSWAILGAIALDETISDTAIASLRDSALPTGGWEWAPGWGADTNSTALAIQALVATGAPVTSTLISKALAYLHSVQNDDGGFPYAASPNAASDTNSTAYVVQALIATGQDPNGPAWTKGQATPISYLLDMQLADGSFQWQAGTGPNLLATTQAIPALLGHAYSNAQQPPGACHTLHAPAIRTR